MARRNGWFRRILVAVLAAAFLLFTLFQFRTSLDDSLRERAYTMLAEATGEQAQSLRALLDNSTDTLAGFALGISHMSDPFETDMTDTLSALVQEGGFRRTALVSPDGTAWVNDGHVINVSDREYFQTSMAGGRGIAFIPNGMLDPIPLLILSVPVWVDGEVAGVVYASYDSDAFGGMLSVASFEGDEYAYIIDTSLRVLAQSANARPLSGVSSAGDVWNKANSIPELAPAKLKACIETGVGGRFTSDLSGETRHAAFAPLGISDWLLICALPGASMTREYAFFSDHTGTLSLMLIVCFAALLVYIVVSGTTAKRRIAASFNELSFLNDSVPGGVFRARMEEGFPLDYLSGQLCALTGRSAGALGTLLTLLDSRDAERAIRGLRRGLAQSGQATETSRLRGLDGVIRSMSVQCRMEDPFAGGNPREHQFVYGILLDVSDRVAAEHALSQALQKYRITLEYTPLVVLEYDFATRTLRAAGTKDNPLAMPRAVEDAPSVLLTGKYVAEDSVETVRDAFRRMTRGEPHVSFEARILVRDGGFLFYRIEMTCLFDAEGAPITAMLLLQNIEREKDAERDPLTGLLNRAGAERRAALAFSDSGKDAAHAFLFMDMDHFKDVNDQYGHHAGDKALVTFADALSGVFRSGDVVARIGGDEFCVLMRDVPDAALPLEKARAVHEALRTAASAGGPALTFSAGIAYYPRHGRDFFSLSEAADRALYRAKEEGRDRVRVAE